MTFPFKLLKFMSKLKNQYNKTIKQASYKTAKNNYC